MKGWPPASDICAAHLGTHPPCAHVATLRRPPRRARCPAASVFSRPAAPLVPANCWTPVRGPPARSLILLALHRTCPSSIALPPGSPRPRGPSRSARPNLGRRFLRAPARAGRGRNPSRRAPRSEVRTPGRTSYGGWHSRRRRTLGVEVTTPTKARG